MLGHAYALCGKIVEWDKLGRKLGFPTANIDAVGLVLPPNGVYAIHALVERRFGHELGLAEIANGAVIEVWIEGDVVTGAPTRYPLA